MIYLDLLVEFFYYQYQVIYFDNKLKNQINQLTVRIVLKHLILLLEVS